MPTPTLYELYTAQGKSLPPPSQRFSDPQFAAAAAAVGITKDQYAAAGSNNGDYNNKIAAALQSSSSGSGSLQGTLTQPQGGTGIDTTGLTSGPSGGIPQPSASVLPQGNPQQQAPSDLGNFRAALRYAAEEGGKTRMGTLSNALGPLGITVPGTIGAISDLLRSSVKPSVEAIFSDYYEAYKTADEYKRKELDRILDLRLQFGTAIPDNVTSLADAVRYVTPLIDAERKQLAEMDALDKKAKEADIRATETKIQEMLKQSTTDTDIEGYAQCLLSGSSSAECGIPNGLRSSAQRRADELANDELSQAFNDEKAKIKNRVERKVSTYANEREQIYNNSDLTFAQQRDLIDYIDSIEYVQKNSKNGVVTGPSSQASAADLNRGTAYTDTSSKTQPGALVKPPAAAASSPTSSNAAQPFVDLFKGFSGS